MIREAEASSVRKTIAPPDEIAKGLELHRAGRLGEAEATYRRIIDSDPDNAEALHLLGLVARQTGQLNTAEALIRKAVRLSPHSAVFHSNLGIVLAMLSRSGDAIAAFEEALRLQPAYPDAAYNLGCVLLNAGQAGPALAAFDRALAASPDRADFHYNRGNALLRCERPADAVAAYDAAIRLRPDYIQALANRGSALSGLGRFRDALATFGEVLRLQPNRADAYYNRGNAFQALGERHLAAGDFGQAVTLKPDYPEAHNNKGVVLRQLGRTDEALAAFNEAIRLRPRYAEAYYNLGNLLRDRGDSLEALAAYDVALSIRSDYAEAHYARGRILKDLGRLGEARAAYDRTIRLQPGWARAYQARAIVLRREGRTRLALADLDEALRLSPGSINVHSLRAGVLGDEARFDEARDAYETALALRPDDADTRTNYLLFLSYDPAQTNATLFEAHREWGRRHGHSAGAYTNHANDPDPDRPIRIGLVSADFGRHPVGYLLDGVLASIDQNRVPVFCYSGRIKEDDLTGRFRGCAAGWRRTIGVSDDELAKTIRADGIDILIDLAGHTAGHRLPCFALKPAPIQATWMGYCSTTGLPAMDYILMDAVHAPPGSERWFSETVVRLPDGHWCYSPPEFAPEVADPPVLRRGHVTFGSFNKLTKINAKVIDTWAAILRQVPTSRLVLKWPSLADEDHRGRLTEAFAVRGVDGARIELRRASPQAELLAEYADIDIALDPFPYSGGVTSCEALWMGLPVVTWPQDRPVSRQTLAQLTELQRPEWVAADADDYVRIAAALAADGLRLRDLRRDQRARMAASPLCDGKRFAANLESALRTMWHNWCAGRATGVRKQWFRKIFGCR